MTDDRQPAELALAETQRMDPADDAIPSPVAAAHRILRGRYRWAIGLALVLSVGGGYVGWRAPQLTYTCGGMIEVAPRVTRILYTTENNTMLDMFDAYVDSQAQLAGSRRVVDMAMASPEWSALGRGIDDESIEKFLRSLSVYRNSRGQFVNVAFTDTDADAATIAVNQVIKAYMKLVEEREAASGLSRITALENLQQTLSSQLKTLERDVLSVTEGLGAEGLDERYKFALGEVNNLDRELNRFDIDIAKLEGADPSAPKDHVPNEREIARYDEVMAKFLAQKAELEMQVKELGLEGLGPNNERVIATKKEIERIDRRIAQRVVDVNSAADGTPDERTARLTELKDRRKAVATLAETAKAETKRLADKKANLLSIDQDKRLKNDKLQDTKRQLDVINTESEVRGRISVLSFGDRPLGPDTDKRRSLAAMGGLGGIVLGFGIVLLSGLRNARLRHIGDVDDRPAVGGGRFLGILPDVPETALAPDAPTGPDTPVELADFCVHHVRTMLQLRAGGRPRVVAVTSPSPGDGKTTLALALGASFAATGARTLVVDCDFIGHGVTSAMRSLVCAAASRTLLAPDGTVVEVPSSRAVRVSDLLGARRMRFQDEQIAELLGAARRLAGRGDPAVDSVVRALEHLSRGSAKGGLGERGVLAVLAGAQLKDCAIDVGIPNLSLLPVGDASAEHAESLSPMAIQRLFAACRERYDTVIVDSGPVRGSLEAALTAAAADHVLMVVSRGGRNALLEEALQRLHRVGATLAGVVFNRALADDVANSSFASRSASFRDVNLG